MCSIEFTRRFYTLFSSAIGVFIFQAFDTDRLARIFQCGICLLISCGMRPGKVIISNYSYLLIKLYGNKMKKIILSASLLLVVGSAQAIDSPKWDSVTVSYQSIDVIDENLNGFGFSGSHSISDDFFVVGSYVSLSTQGDYGYIEEINNEPYFFSAPADFEFNTLSAGIGYRTAVSSHSDLFTAVSYVGTKVKATLRERSASDSNKDNGYNVQVGLRSLVTPNIELSSSLVYTDIGESSDTGASVAVAYHITELFSLGLSYSKSDDSDGFSGNATFSF